MTLDGSHTFPENSAAGTLIGNIIVTDQDFNQLPTCAVAKDYSNGVRVICCVVLVDSLPLDLWTWSGCLVIFSLLSSAWFMTYTSVNLLLFRLISLLCDLLYLQALAVAGTGGDELVCGSRTVDYESEGGVPLKVDIKCTDSTGLSKTSTFSVMVTGKQITFQLLGFLPENPRISYVQDIFPFCPYFSG